MARRLAGIVLAALLAVALTADFLASDRPIVLSLDGETYFFANLIEYDELRGLGGAELRAHMLASDWAIWAPVRHGATSVRSSGRLEPLRGPSAEHWLGTDDRGRDVLARLMHGTRATLVVALGAALLGFLFGAALAILAVFSGGVFDSAALALADGVSAFPALLVVVAAQGLFGTSSLWLVLAIIAAPRAADSARLARSAMQRALAEPYSDAARALGATRLRIVLRHAFPQATSALFVAAALTASTAVLAEAALSFLGFGISPPTASWGELLRQANDNDLALWLLLPAGIAITTAAACFGALGTSRRARSRRRS